MLTIEQIANKLSSFNAHYANWFKLLDCKDQILFDLNIDPRDCGWDAKKKMIALSIRWDSESFSWYNIEKVKMGEIFPEQLAGQIIRIAKEA